MRNFRKAALMVVILLCMEKAAGFALEPVKYQHSLERELKYMEEQGWKPNAVCLGDSTIQCGLVPGIIEDAVGGDFCILNAATSSQQVWGAYYYLKDLQGQYDLDYVVLGVDLEEYILQNQSIQKDLLVLDRIKNPLIRLEYVSSIFQPAEYPYLLKSYAYRSEYKNIFVNLRNKFSAKYLFGKEPELKKENLARGYVERAAMGEDKVGIGKELDCFSKETLDYRAVEYLDKIVELCKENEIKLYLVNMPAVVSSIYVTETYKDFWKFFCEYGKANQVAFWDMNMLKDREKIISDGMMLDDIHVGKEGACSVSRKLGELIEKDMRGENVEGEFLTFSEWYDGLDGILGCSFFTESIPKVDDRIMYGVSLHKENVIPEYEFLISLEGENGGWIKLQEYGVGDTCVVPGEYFEQDVWMKVYCREKGSGLSYERCYVAMREKGAGE